MPKVLKWILIVLGSVVALIGVAAIVVYFGAQARIDKKYEIAVKPITLYSDSLTIAEGKYLGTAVAKCVDCHGDNLGGKVFIDAPIGHLEVPNITTGKGSVTREFRDTDWVRAIRHGIAPDGRPLWLMPAEEYQSLSASEINAIVSWVRSMPAVNNEMNERSLTLLGRALFVAGELPMLTAEVIDHNAPLPAAPKAEATVDYGRHMAMTGGCVGCHRPDFSGGAIPGTPPDWPPARNISPDAATGIGNWTEADFFRALREGKRPNGDTINSVMPWRYTAQLKDVAIKALYLYLRSVPAKATKPA